MNKVVYLPKESEERLENILSYYRRHRVHQSVSFIFQRALLYYYENYFVKNVLANERQDPDFFEQVNINEFA